MAGRPVSNTSPQTFFPAHSGPQGIRDDWGFNPETRLFTSRSYATLQVNFRISGGYGKEFRQSGYKQTGRKARDDVEDEVYYAIAQGWTDKSKAAICGQDQDTAFRGSGVQ